MNKKELLVVGIIAFIAILSLLMIDIMNNSDADQYVVVTVDNELYRKIPLTEVTSEVVDIHVGDQINTLVITEGLVNMTFANCPDLVCVDTKPASQTGDMIVCLPHRVIVEISH